MSKARTAVVRPRGGARLRRAAAFALLSLMLAACSSGNIPRLADAPAAPQPEKQKLLSASEQREHLRILAAYGGVYVVTAILWLWTVDGVTPDRWDVVGGAVALAGMMIIMFAPR